MYDNIFDAGDIDGDGMWSFEEYNAVLEKMENPTVGRDQFEFLCIEVGDDPKRGLSKRYLSFLHREHDGVFSHLLYQTARALDVTVVHRE